jgi:hypothetical protein
MGTLVDNDRVMARVLVKMFKVLKEHDILIKPGVTPSDLDIDFQDLSSIETMAGEMIDPVVVPAS